MAHTDHLRGDRILSSIVNHLREEAGRHAVVYNYAESNVCMKAIDVVYSIHMQVRADVLNIARENMTAADVPSCYPGFGR